MSRRWSATGAGPTSTSTIAIAVTTSGQCDEPAAPAASWIVRNPGTGYGRWAAPRAAVTSATTPTEVNRAQLAAGPATGRAMTAAAATATATAERITSGSP
ncbi:hypothetical protein OHB54_06510 [Streptomyces sp. NBC_01007]|nr:hypothetical protein OHB54_06510 [Streptomyces sp. NBC_01007]